MSHKWGTPATQNNVRSITFSSKDVGAPNQQPTLLQSVPLFRLSSYNAYETTRDSIFRKFQQRYPNAVLKENQNTLQQDDEGKNFFTDFTIEYQDPSHLNAANPLDYEQIYRHMDGIKLKSDGEVQNFLRKAYPNINAQQLKAIKTGYQGYLRAKRAGNSQSLTPNATNSPRVTTVGEVFSNAMFDFSTGQMRSQQGQMTALQGLGYSPSQAASVLRTTSDYIQNMQNAGVDYAGTAANNPSALASLEGYMQQSIYSDSELLGSEERMQTVGPQNTPVTRGQIAQYLNEYQQTTGGSLSDEAFGEFLQNSYGVQDNALLNSALGQFRTSFQNGGGATIMEALAPNSQSPYAGNVTQIPGYYDSLGTAGEQQQQSVGISAGGGANSPNLPGYQNRQQVDKSALAGRGIGRLNYVPGQTYESQSLLERASGTIGKQNIQKVADTVMQIVQQRPGATTDYYIKQARQLNPSLNESLIKTWMNPILAEARDQGYITEEMDVGGEEAARVRTAMYEAGEMAMMSDEEKRGQLADFEKKGLIAPARTRKASAFEKLNYGSAYNKKKRELKRSLSNLQSEESDINAQIAAQGGIASKEQQKRLEEISATQSQVKEDLGKIGEGLVEWQSTTERLDEAEKRLIDIIDSLGKKFDENGNLVDYSLTDNEREMVGAANAGTQAFRQRVLQGKPAGDDAKQKPEKDYYGEARAKEGLRAQALAEQWASKGAQIGHGLGIASKPLGWLAGGTRGSISGAIEGFKSADGGIFDKIKGALSGARTGAKSGAKSGASKAVASLTKAGAGVGMALGAIAGVFTGIVGVAKLTIGAFKKVSESAERASNAMKSLAKYNGRLGQATAISRGKEFRREVKFARDVAKSGQKVIEANDNLKDSMAPFKKSWTKAINSVIALITNMFAGLARGAARLKRFPDTIKAIFRQVGKSLKWAGDLLKKGFNAIVTPIKKAASSVYNSFVKLATSVTEAIKSFILKLPWGKQILEGVEWVATKTGEGVDAVKEGVKQAAETTVNVAKGAKDAVVETISSPEKTMEAADNYAGALADIGTNILDRDASKARFEAFDKMKDLGTMSDKEREKTLDQLAGIDTTLFGKREVYDSQMQEKRNFLLSDAGKKEMELNLAQIESTGDLARKFYETGDFDEELFKNTLAGKSGVSKEDFAKQLEENKGKFEEYIAFNDTSRREKDASYELYGGYSSKESGKTTTMEDVAKALRPLKNMEIIQQTINKRLLSVDNHTLKIEENTKKEPNKIANDAMMKMMQTIAGEHRNMEGTQKVTGDREKQYGRMAGEGGTRKFSSSNWGLK